MSNPALIQLAHRLDPALWAEKVLQLPLDAWQASLVRSQRGTRIIALTFRQAGKSSAAAVAVSHTMKFNKNSVSLVLSPTQRQSAELLRKVRQQLTGAGARLAVDNAFSLELDNGARALAMPGADDASIRGLSIDGVLVIDEAARVADSLYDASRPMLARHSKKARLVLLSTAWLKSGFFFRTWSDGGKGWLRLEVLPEDTNRIPPDFLAAERRALGERAYLREYENQFDSTDTRFFDPDMLARAFGEGSSPSPPEQDDEDKVISRVPAFAGRLQ